MFVYAFVFDPAFLINLYASFFWFGTIFSEELFCLCCVAALKSLLALSFNALIIPILRIVCTIAVWSPAGKELTSWLSCLLCFVTFPNMSWSTSELRARFASWNWLKQSSEISYWLFQGGTSFVDHFFSVLCVLCICVRLFIFALWSPAVKWLTAWLSYMVSNCEFATFPLLSWVRSPLRCCTWLYRFLIFAPLLTLVVLLLLCFLFYVCGLCVRTSVVRIV